MTNRVVYDPSIARKEKEALQIRLRQEFGMELDNGTIVVYEGTFYGVTNDYPSGDRVPYFYVLNNTEYKAAIKDGRIT